ncbi:hypothetical protein JL720_11867 [Aureococcus anophagefferens]|nr:hypothetical protein JL720_11867 [Aureococcus anophagefferens]
MAYAILQAAPACLIAGRQNLSPGNLYSLAEDRHAFTWAADDDEACPYAFDGGAAPPAADVVPGFASCAYAATFDDATRVSVTIDATADAANVERAAQDLARDPAAVAPPTPRAAAPALAPGAARAWPYKVLSLGAGAGRKRAEAPHLDGPGTQAFSCLLYARDPADNRTGGGLELYENFVPDGAKYPAPADIALGRVIPYAANRLVCNLNSRAAVHASEPSAGDLTTPRRFLLYRAGLEEPLFSFKEGSQAH